MSNQDIIDTIADDFNNEIVGNSIDYNGGRLTLSRSRDLAAQALAALRAAGYVIVKLPEPDSPLDGDGQVFFDQYMFRADPTGSMQYRRVITDFGMGSEYRTEFPPARARSFAAALLAAADAAEEGK